MYYLSLGTLNRFISFHSKAVEKEDNGVSFMETIAMIDGMNNQKQSSSPGGATAGGVVSSSDVMSSPSFSAVTGTSKESAGVHSEELAQLKKSLQDVQVIAETREKKIAEVRLSSTDGDPFMACFDSLEAPTLKARLTFVHSRHHYSS